MNRELSAVNVLKILMICIFSLVVIACSSGGGSNSVDHATKPVTKEMALNQAVNAEQSGDTEQALYYYIQALEFDPKDAKILYRIAYIQDQRGNNAIALKAYTQVIENDPSMILAYQGLAIIQMGDKSFKQAKANLKEAIKLDQTRLKGLRESTSKGYETLDKDSPIKSYNVLGVIEDMQRNFDAARILYNLILATNANSANALSNMGYSYYLTGQLKIAEQYFKKSVNADPKFRRAWANLGLVYVRKRQYNRAIKTFKQVMTEFDAYNDIGYFVMLDGRLDEAEYFFQKAIDMSPSYFAKAYSNLELVQMKKREHWLVEQEGQGTEIAVSKLKKDIYQDTLDSPMTIFIDNER